jgi:putative transposase
MAYRKTQFVNGEYYHVLNRGIEGRDIFTNKTDYQRFLESLKEFNTTVRITLQNIRKKDSNRIAISQIGEKLVEILCYSLLPNHFHLLLKQVADNGVTEFMRKLGVGYTCYFNLKYERQGHLFQGAFRATHINKESQFLHISRYIHLNVLDLFAPRWREGKIDAWEKVKKFLENYPWSSYPAFAGKQNSILCHPNFLKEIFKTPQEYEIFLKSWAERGSDEVNTLCLE